MLSNGSEPTSSAYFRPALGGDMAAMRGIAKFLLHWEREALANKASRRCSTMPSSPSTPGASMTYLAEVDATSWTTSSNSPA